MDLKELTDEELEEIRLEVAKECERRADLESIPGQIKELRDKYISGGGDPHDIEDGGEDG